jgi:hypothetical protein
MEKSLYHTKDEKITNLLENIKKVKLRNYLNANQTYSKFNMKFKRSASSRNFSNHCDIDNLAYKTNGFSVKSSERDSNYNTRNNFYKTNFNQTTSSNFSPFYETNNQFMNTNKNPFNKTANSNFFEVTSRPLTVYKENDMTSLISLYHMNNQELSGTNSDIKNNFNKKEKKELYEKFEILEEKDYKKQMETIKATVENKRHKPTILEKITDKFSKHEIRCNDNFFNDPTNSLQKLKLNNQIFDRVMGSRENKQCETYDNKLQKDFHEFMVLLQMKNVKESDKIDKNKNEKNKEYLEEYTVQYNLNLFRKQQTLTKKVSRKYLLENIILNNHIKELKYKPKARAQFTLNITDDKIYLFGGLNSDKLCDFWICNIKDNYTWQPIYFNEDSEPAPRYGHTSVLYKKELYIYGGAMPNKNLKPSEELIIFNTQSNFFYEPDVINKNIAHLRRNHVAVGVGSHMFVHGGIGANEKVLSDAITFDFLNRRWGTLDIEGKNSVCLVFHCAELVLSQDKMNSQNFNLFHMPELPFQLRNSSKLKIEGIYVFGGIDGDRNLNNDLRILLIGKKPLKWITPDVSGSPPLPRMNGTINYFAEMGIIIIHGGRNDKRDLIFNDIFILDLFNLVWIKTRCDPIIDTRTEHNSVIYGERLLILGGTDTLKYKKFDLLMVDLDLYNYKRNLERNLEKATKNFRNSMGRLNEKSKICQINNLN